MVVDESSWRVWKYKCSKKKQNIHIDLVIYSVLNWQPIVLTYVKNIFEIKSYDIENDNFSILLVYNKKK